MSGVSISEPWSREPTECININPWFLPFFAKKFFPERFLRMFSAYLKYFNPPVAKVLSSIKD